MFEDRHPKRKLPKLDDGYVQCRVALPHETKYQHSVLIKTLSIVVRNGCENDLSFSHALTLKHLAYMCNLHAKMCSVRCPPFDILHYFVIVPRFLIFNNTTHTTCAM